MAFNFTKEQIAKCAPRNKNAAELYEALSQVLPKYDINTPERVAAFMAQCVTKAWTSAYSEKI